MGNGLCVYDWLLFNGKEIMPSYICICCDWLEDSPPRCIVVDSGWGKPTVCPMDGTRDCDFKEESEITLCQHQTINCQKRQK